MANVTDQQMRDLFFELIAETAAEFSLEARLHKPLNEIYLFDRAEQSPIKFYQDHCRDQDCGNCRKNSSACVANCQRVGGGPLLP